MRIEGNYLLGTWKAISAYLLKDIKAAGEVDRFSYFCRCDFARILGCAEDYTSLSEMAEDASCWCGIRRVGSPYGGDYLTLVADRFNGGHLICGQAKGGKEAIEKLTSTVEGMMFHALNDGRVFTEDIVREDELLIARLYDIFES